jgi:hypothetical protein
MTFGNLSRSFYLNIQTINIQSEGLSEMKYWSREDTKAYVAQLEDRIEDIAYYIEKTEQWCDENYIDDERVIFMCMFLTAIWVSQLRCEPISYVELMEMLGVEDIPEDEEKFYELNDTYADLTHKELLIRAVKTFDY